MSSNDATQDHQAAWGLDSMVEKFAHKTSVEFFRSETHFMPTVAAAGSVLDVGCASGRLVELLADHLRSGFRFTGIDIVPASIDRARRTYPQHTFHLGDYLDTPIDGPYDLVNATGVVQHEPRYREVVCQMIDHASQWVLFDAKTAPTDVDLIDKSVSFVDIQDTRLYFNILAHGPFVTWLTDLPRVRKLSIFGYQTKPNERTTVPDEFGPFASSGFLIELGDKPSEVPVNAEIPDFLLAPS